MSDPATRYAISHHTDSPEGEHFDLFLEHGQVLKTWRIQRPAFTSPQSAQRIDDHRLSYLEYEGAITRDRGAVKLWDNGVYQPDSWTEERIVVALQGRRLKTRLKLTRSAAAETAMWTIIDASSEMRRFATTLLRQADLNVAPTPALEDLQAGLVLEERALLALVDAYARGGAVAWDRAVVDDSLRERLTAERARWRHPWLDAAVGHAERLAEMARLIRAARPPGKA